jgi:WD40 repeat protein
VGTLQLLEAAPGDERTGADLFCCTYSADGAFVLTAGWDGWLRFWAAPAGTEVTGLRVGPKPLSSCAISPDGRNWLAGSIEGWLSVHDASTLMSSLNFVAHTRPISSIRYSPDGEQLTTSSWDRQVVLRKVGKEREGKALAGHTDIVAGCRYSADGQQLLSWSYDGSARLWDASSGRELAYLTGHEDRVTAAALSPDGKWVASGGRDGVVKLWDLATQTATRTVVQSAEIRGLFFLLDGESLVSVNAAGRVGLLTVPTLEVQTHLKTDLKVQCAELSPNGQQVVLGCEDGRVHFIAVEGLEESSLLVTATERAQESRGVLGRIWGSPRVVNTYQYTCPACRQTAETKTLPSQPFPCPACQRRLRVNTKVRQMQQS